MTTTQERLTLRSNVCSAASTLLPLCSVIEPTTLTPTEKKHLSCLVHKQDLLLLLKGRVFFFLIFYVCVYNRWCLCILLSPLQHRYYRHAPPCLAFYMGTGKPNSSPHSCVASTGTSDPLSQSQPTLFLVQSLKNEVGMYS